MAKKIIRTMRDIQGYSHFLRYLHYFKLIPSEYTNHNKELLDTPFIAPGYAPRIVTLNPTSIRGALLNNLAPEYLTEEELLKNPNIFNQEHPLVKTYYPALKKFGLANEITLSTDSELKKLFPPPLVILLDKEQPSIFLEYPWSPELFQLANKATLLLNNQININFNDQAPLGSEHIILGVFHGKSPLSLKNTLSFLEHQSEHILPKIYEALLFNPDPNLLAINAAVHHPNPLIHYLALKALQYSPPL